MTKLIRIKKMKVRRKKTKIINLILKTKKKNKKPKKELRLKNKRPKKELRLKNKKNYC